MGLRKRIRRVSRKVSRIVNSAVQWLSTSNHASSSSSLLTSTHYSISTTTANATVLLSGITQGTGASNRSGNKVSLLRATFRGFTYASVANSFSPIYNVGRIVVIHIKNNNGQSLGSGCTDWGLLLQDYTASGNASTVLSTWRPDMVPTKVRILKDMYLNPMNVNVCASGVAGANYSRIMKWKFSLNLRKLLKGAVTTYNTTTASATSCESNHLAIFFMQSNPTPADAGSLASVWSYKLSFLP